MRLNKILPLLLALFAISSYSAQISISEYSASNLNQFPDVYGKYEDWIEIHNEGSEAVDISGYGISDKESKPQKWLIPEGTILEGDSYLVLWCSSRDTLIRGDYHTNFKLTQTKDNEFVLLSNPDGSVIESQQMEITLLGHSRTKVNGTWKINTTPSLGRANNTLSNIIDRYTNAPSITQAAGFYQNEVVVSIVNNEANSELRYTLDGTLPVEDSPLYTDPLTITTTTVVKARSFVNDPVVLPGKIDFKTFFINESFTMNVISIAADRLQDLANGEGELRPIGSIEYFRDGELSSNSYGELNRHGQDSWVNPQRSLDWVSRDEMGYSKALQEKVFTTSDRDEYQRFMLRASGDDNYPAINDLDHRGATHMRDEYVHELARKGNLKLDIRTIERTIVFLNGDYWGIYSPRERPVDHDYTSYYYDQDKFDLQYILTWGDTWTEYGGQQAMDDWDAFRDFIMNTDMSNPEAYEVVKDGMNLTSLIDYMVVNLNVVCSDWINYNTGWWRGLNPEGDHKKWGYILWDNDATFDYYINYSGVPNTQPDALPCDIDEISEFMDDFFAFGGGGGGGGGIGIDSTFAAFCPTITTGASPYPASDSIFLLVVNENFSCCVDGWSDECQQLYDDYQSGLVNGLDPEACFSITSGSSPYPADDPNFLEVIAQDEFCCAGNWDQVCQNLYDLSVNGSPDVPGTEVRRDDNVGMHEKIFLKLQDESPEFRQLYYSRQADLNNTVFSCDNMLETLDSLKAIIEPEMPRHIDRWGRSINEWQNNFTQLRDFVERRCEVLNEGMTDCYEVTGPHALTLEIFPEGAGDIDLNTIEVKNFPWTGEYFGDMENLIDADPESDYDFLRWETKNGSAIFPDANTERASLILTGPDTLVAVFQLETVATDNLADKGIKASVFPSPTHNLFTVEFSVEESSTVQVSVLNLVGEKLIVLPEIQAYAQQTYSPVINLATHNLAAGSYIVNIQSDYGSTNKKVIYVN